MLLNTIDKLQSDPLGAILQLLVFLVSLVIAISVHEFSHALVATKLGDPTPRRMGRLTLHPMAHLDPMGTVMILLAGFGWGKPVQVYPGNLRPGVRSGMAVVSLAGPISNFLMAMVLAIAIRALVAGPSYSLFAFRLDALLGSFLLSAMGLNLILGIFNLIPIAPLDGFKVALGLLPRNAANSFARLERYGPVILMLVILYDVVLPGRGILSAILGPVLSFLVRTLLG